MQKELGKRTTRQKENWPKRHGQLGTETIFQGDHVDRDNSLTQEGNKIPATRKNHSGKNRNGMILMTERERGYYIGHNRMEEGDTIC